MLQCDAPKNTGWRPGARWARRSDERHLARPLAGVDEATGGATACWAGETRADVERRIAAMPAHQRPPMREMGRRSEAAEMPFKRLPGDEACPERLPQAGSRRSGKSTGSPEPSAPPLVIGPNGLIDRPPSPFAGLDPNADPQAASAIAHWRAPASGWGTKLATGVPSVNYPGEGPRPDKLARRGSNDPDATVSGVAAFFDTGRTMQKIVGRVCWADEADPAPIPRDAAPPLVTVHRIGSRVEVAAASPTARAIGIERGMALTQARAAVPGLIVRDADAEGDRADLMALALLLARRWAPSVALAGDDGLCIDLSGVSHLHGGEERFARRLVRLLARRGIGARVAVADTHGAAWALARHSGAAVAIVPPGRHGELLVELPVAALRLDPAAVELLARLGIDRIGELAAVPRGPLVRRFGRAVAERLDQAHGRIAEPIDPVVPAKPIAVTQRFAEPIATPEAIAHWLGALVARLATALAETGQGARLVELVGARVDNRPQRLCIGLARPTRDPQHLLKLIARRIEEIEPGYGLDALTLHLRRAEPLGPQALALAEQLGEDKVDLTPLIDNLANRIGQRRLWRTRPVESDVPERSAAAAPPLDPPGHARPEMKLDDVRRLDRRALDRPWHKRWPRPVRLLRRPEPLDHVLAELPDQPPRRFTWRGLTHRVIRADGPERIAGEWWTRPGEATAVRDYFQVEDEVGARFWVFRRGDGVRAETGDLNWYLHGTFG